MKVYLSDGRRFEGTLRQDTSADPLVIVCTRSTKSLEVQARESIYQFIGHAFPKEFQIAIELR